MDDWPLDGYLYHMVSLSNLESILRKQAILSKESVLAQKIAYASIAEESVQRLRDRVYIWDFSERRWRSVHSYVPFYFAKRTPMLFRRKDVQHDIIFFEISRLILKDPGVLFTDGNVANQQLAQSGMEIVRIIPATSGKALCRRKYIPSGPLGTNSDHSKVYADTRFLENLDWPVINGYWFNTPEAKRIKHAEVLIPDYVPLSKVTGISVMNQEKSEAVNRLIKQYKLEGRIPSAATRRDLYF